MEIGMEQLIWVIILIIFIVATYLKNRGKKKSGSTIERTKDTRQKERVEREKLSTHMEEVLGKEISESKPQIKIEKAKPKPLEKRVKPKPEIEKKIGEFVSPLFERAKKEKEHLPPEKKDIYREIFPWGSMAKKDLPRAIILSEIIGPPIAKRKTHRLF
ncbi:MAG: hypothetical protein SCARUB_01217 [Candidatus Scalindua rubra]|uniref:Uncharacterized protein n=1 Tax=Candidatus Scalindua rubra TaxID=1872076 RepID=A0A1E3XD98_9BACT|nr:MAG: hypothetical protein SCARUB_01217 [Candidatus Scalindua rubra]